MRRLSPFFIIVGGFLCFWGARRRPEPPGRGTDIDAFGPLLKPGFTYVQQIPDSLRTPEQKKLVKKILTLSAQHMKAVDNRMVFDMSREEYRQNIRAMLK